MNDEPKPEPKAYLTRTEAARHLGVSLHAFDKLRARPVRPVPGRLIGKRAPRFKRSDLDDWLARECHSLSVTASADLAAQLLLIRERRVAAVSQLLKASPETPAGKLRELRAAAADFAVLELALSRNLQTE